MVQARGLSRERLRRPSFNLSVEILMVQAVVRSGFMNRQIEFQSLSRDSDGSSAEGWVFQTVRYPGFQSLSRDSDGSSTAGAPGTVDFSRVSISQSRF